VVVVFAGGEKKSRALDNIGAAPETAIDIDGDLTLHRIHNLYPTNHTKIPIVKREEGAYT